MALVVRSRPQVTDAGVRRHLVVNDAEGLPLAGLSVPESNLPPRPNETVFSDFYIVGGPHHACFVPRAAIFRQYPSARQSSGQLHPRSIVVLGARSARALLPGGVRNRVEILASISISTRGVR